MKAGEAGNSIRFPEAAVRQPTAAVPASVPGTRK